jgi:hypothetical protein
MLADFWFDPACPYTWLTSRWLVEVTSVRPVTVRWRVMSLSVLNEGRDNDPEGDPHGYLWFPVRVCAAVQRQHGHDALGRFYTELWRPGTRDGDWMGDHADALERAGLPRQLVDVGASTAHDDEVRASHAAAMAELGPHVGTPTVATTRPDGTRVAFFGPVVSHVPTGERAGALWDATLVIAGTPGFHELKATAHVDPDLSYQPPP